MISAAHVDAKGRLISMNLALFNEKWTSILQGLSTTGSLEHFVQNHQVLREISLILRVNERMVVAVGTAMHGQLANIYCASAGCGVSVMFPSAELQVSVLPADV